MNTATVTLSPEMASVIADALEIAMRRTTTDHADHSRRVAEAHSRTLRGEATDTDRGTIGSAESVRTGIELLHDAQGDALDLMLALGGNLDPVESARAIAD